MWIDRDEPTFGGLDWDNVADRPPAALQVDSVILESLRSACYPDVVDLAVDLAVVDLAVVDLAVVDLAKDPARSPSSHPRNGRHQKQVREERVCWGIEELDRSLESF